MRIVAISDIHLTPHRRGPYIPDGDLLIVAGDLTDTGSSEEWTHATAWIESLPHAHKVFIAGNHDFAAQKIGAQDTWAGATYLKEWWADVAGLSIWGSPWTPWFGGWAFNYHKSDAEMRWRNVPANMDILVTHGPPLGYGDGVFNGRTMENDEHVGCPALLKCVEEKQPRLHFFGHIHEGHGGPWQLGRTKMYNVAQTATVVDYNP